VALDGVALTDANAPSRLTLEASDPDADALGFTIVTPPTHGTLDPIAGETTVYIPADGYQGLDSFTFKANDGSLDSNLATVLITVAPANHAPIASDGTAATAGDRAKQLTLGANDLQPRRRKLAAAYDRRVPGVAVRDPAGQYVGTHDLGDGTAGPDADRLERDVGGLDADELRLPVAALRFHGRRVHEHLRCDGTDVRARGGRCRSDDPRRRHRDQLRRLGLGHVGADGAGAGSTDGDRILALDDDGRPPVYGERRSLERDDRRRRSCRPELERDGLRVQSGGRERRGTPHLRQALDHSGLSRDEL